MSDKQMIVLIVLICLFGSLNLAAIAFWGICIQRAIEVVGVSG